MLTLLKDDKEKKDLAIKSFGALAFKDEEKGEVEAIVATLGVVDKDGDIIREGAIKSGAKVQMSDYGHNLIWGGKPVGKGTLDVEKNKAIFRGRLFLKTAGGRDTFEMLKELDGDAEWSFGFRVTGWEAPSEDEQKKGVFRIITKLEAFEVSPVLRGAGVGTRTTAVKSEGDPPPAEPTPEPEPTPTPEQIAAKEKAGAEAKAASDRAAAERKERDAEVLEDFHRVQRTLRRLGQIS